MRRKTIIFCLVWLFGLPLLTRCGSGLCINQAGCPDGSWSFGSFLDAMASTLHRDKTTAQITLRAELLQGTEDLPAGYRKFPRIGNDILPTAGDDDGGFGGSVTFALRPTTSCGSNQLTVAARIADCAAQNPTRANWDGAVSGNSGQGTWSLVTYNGAHEVWRDARTNLLWSDNLGFTNWCRASGASGGGPFGEVDQYNICDSAFNQDQVTPESWCTEHPGVNTPATYDSMKGGMRFAATGTSPSVVWRLPTKWDYHQAEIDGIRFTLPNMTGGFWSASVSSDFRGLAWYYFGSNGLMGGTTRGTAFGTSVRCVGR